MAINVRCERAAGDKEGPSISDAMITSEGMAVSRGKRWLDDPQMGAYYTTYERTVRVPHRGSTVVPNRWVALTASKLGLNSQLVKVKSYAIHITRDAVWATMETEQYEEPSA